MIANPYEASLWSGIIKRCKNKKNTLLAVASACIVMMLFGCKVDSIHDRRNRVEQRRAIQILRCISANWVIEQEFLTGGVMLEYEIIHPVVAKSHERDYMLAIRVLRWWDGTNGDLIVEAPGMRDDRLTLRRVSDGLYDGAESQYRRVASLMFFEKADELGRGMLPETTNTILEAWHQGSAETIASWGGDK